MKKRVLSLILMVCLLLGMFPAAGLAAGAEEGSTADATVPFSDVKEGDWFYDGVRYSYANGFFTGTGGGNYDPDGTMSRAMFLTVLGRMAGIDEADYAGDTGFVDVAEEAWYAPYVKWAVKYGITRGISEDIFSPDEPVSRQQMAVFFVRYLEAFDVETLTEEEITTTPADLDQAAPWAQEAVLKLWEMGFLNGDGTNFDPEGNATRAQTAVFCQRIDRGVDTWYVAPGQPSQRVSVEPDDAIQKPTRRPSKNRTQYCSVSFEMGDGQDEITLPQTQSVVKGSAVNALPTPYKAGVIFLGWYYDRDLTRAAAGSDTIDTNLTLYAKTTAGEEVQPLETPNYMTDTEVEAGEYRFEVYGASSEADLKFTNITGGNLAVDFTLNGTTVTATLEAGQTYQVELVKDTAEFVVDGQRQGTSIRYRNILTKKEESKQASLNRGVVQMPYSEEMGLASSVFQGLYTVDETNTVAENTTTGTFTYTDGVLNVGETVAIKKGNVDLDDPSSTEGDVAYLKIIGKNGNQYTYEMAEVEDVLFMPDVLPIQSDWDTDDDTTDNSITISAENLAKAMGQVEADSLDEGDYLGFLASGKAYSDSTADIESYGRITAFGDDGTGKYILTYTPATEEEIEKTLDVYYEQDREVTMGEEEIAEIEAEIKEDVENSGYAEQASAYLAAVMLESDNLTTVPDAGAVEERMGEIELSALRSGVSGRKGKQSVKVEFDKKNINVKLKANGKLEHLKGKGFHVSINIPFKVTIGSGNNKVEIDITATFQEEIVLKQKISTKRHKIGFLKYDYSLNASFEVGNYTGIGFAAEIKTAGEEDKSMIEKLDEIMERMEDYHEAGGVTTTDGTMEGLSEIYQSVMENANDTWIDIVEVKLFENNGNAFLHIFCWQVKGTFVVSANLAVSMGMSFEYITQKQYNFSVRVKAKTSTNQTIDIITPQYNFDFYVVGTIGIRAGIRLEMYVGLFSLKLDKIGISAEAGAYARLWGYFFYHLQWKQGAGKTQSSAGAMLIEIGMYLDIKFVAQLFNSSKLSWCPTIYAKEWPLWSAGERQNVYDFAITNDTAYSFQKTKTLTLPGTTYAMKSMDLKNGNISQISKDDNTESHFQISFSNDKFQYDPRRNTVTVGENADPMGEETDMIVIWRKAPLSFSSKPIQKVIHITWSDPDNVFAMSFDTMGGTAVNQIVAGKGAEIIRPENPEKVGYVFAGWYEDEAYSMPFRFSDDTLTAMPDHNLTLYAKWDPATDTKYTVEHYYENLNGTYELQITDSDTYRGTTDGQTNATALSQDSDKYTAKSVDQQTIAADGSTVVKIYYDLNSYTVTFKDGVSEDNTIAKTYKHGETLAVPTFARKGYTFWDWNTEFDTDEDQNPIAIQDVTFTAQWSLNDNTISFVSNGGSEVETKTVKTGMTFDAPVTPTKTGYDFNGWFTDPSCLKEWDFATGTVSSSMTLYAKWEGEKYTVNFDQNQGETLSASSKQVTFGAVYGNLPTSTRTGYTFVGWFTAAIGGEKVEAATPVLSSAKDQTLYAHWTEADVSYTVKHKQQNLVDDSYTEVVADRQALTGKTNAITEAQAKTYEGFTANSFEQKTISADGTTVVEISYDRNRYNITWNVNGGDALTGDGYTEGQVKYGTTIIVPETPSKNGYEFVSWSPAPGTVPAHNQEFTAQWTEASYTITYDLNGGTISGSNPDTYTYGKGVSSFLSPTKDGYTFAGWYDGETKVTEISATKTGNITLHAKWGGIAYTVTFDVNGGKELEEAVASKAVFYGDTYGELPTPTRDNYEFLYWCTKPEADTECKVIAETKVTVTEDQTLYAIWKPEIRTYQEYKIAGELIQVDPEGKVIGYEGVTYSSKYNTLTLNNATIEASYKGALIECERGLNNGKGPNIELKGTNTIKNTATDGGEGDTICGIKMEACTDPTETVLSGMGTLNIIVADNPNADQVIAIWYAYDRSGSLRIGEAKINAQAGQGKVSYGILVGAKPLDDHTSERSIHMGINCNLVAQGYTRAICALKIENSSLEPAEITASENYDGSVAQEATANNETLKATQYRYISAK